MICNYYHKPSVFIYYVYDLFNKRIILRVHKYTFDAIIQ